MPRDDSRDRPSSSKDSICDKWRPFATEYDPIKVGSIDGTDTVPHDKGIIRALASEYVPNKRVQGKPSRMVFVGRLNPRTTQETILQEFSKVGKVVSCRLVRDIVTGKSKRYAFVEYDSSKSAQEARRALNMELLDGTEVLVDAECERTLPGWKPRRLGGGFGGRKEAGQLRFGCRTRPFLEPIVVMKDDRIKGHREYSESRGDWSEKGYDRNEKGYDRGQKVYKGEKGYDKSDKSFDRSEKGYERSVKTYDGGEKSNDRSEKDPNRGEKSYNRKDKYYKERDRSIDLYSRSEKGYDRGEKSYNKRVKCYKERDRSNESYSRSEKSNDRGEKCYDRSDKDHNKSRKSYDKYYKERDRSTESYSRSKKGDKSDKGYDR